MLLCLPQEVLLDVTSHLNVDDKINLMTTCHILKSLISEKSLYEVLSFYGNKEQTENIIQKFKSKQLNGLQVKKLELKLDTLSDQMFTELPEVFPNVTRIFDYSDQSVDRKRDEKVMDSFLKWKDTIEYSGTSEDRFLITRLLEKTIFSRLTALDVTLSYNEYNDTTTPHRHIHILPCVTHAPLLKKLRLFGCKLNITLLEEIHDACPGLNSLTLEGYLEVNQLKVPAIKPAKHLLYLNLGWEFIISDSHCVFLDYITTKYPNLRQLLFFPTFAKYMVNYALHKFYAHEFDENGFDGPSITSRRDEFENTRDAYYSKGGRRLLSRLPSSIKTLEMDSILFNSVIPSLEQTKINPQTLKFQKRFEDTHVFQEPYELSYLQSLTLLKQMKVTLASSMQAYNDGIASYSLTKLTISIKGEDTFDVSWLLSVFPSLTDLVIDISSAMLIGGEGKDKTVYPNLRKLEVGECLVHPNLLDFFTTATPNIEDLAWSILGESYHHSIIRKHFRNVKQEKVVEEKTQKNYHVDLSNLNRLEKVHLQINRGQDEEDREYDIYGEIKIQDQTRKLVFSENFKPAIEVTAADGVCDFEKMSKVTVLCDHIKRIKINYNIWIEKEGDDINLVIG